MSDTIPAEPETLPDNAIPVDWEPLTEHQIFAGIVGQEIDARLGAHLDGIKKDINAILSLVQRVVTLETKVAKHDREIEDIQAWRKLVNEKLGLEAAE